MARRTGVALAAARVADELGLPRHGRAGCESLEAYIVRCVDGLFVELGEQDVGDRAKDTFWRAFDQVGEAYENLAFAQTDCGVQRCETAKANRDWRDRRPRA